jgi:superfamily II DNA or RNA helicase
MAGKKRMSRLTNRGPRRGKKGEAGKGGAAARALAARPKGGWRTTDAQEIEKRRARGREEPITVGNLEPDEPFYSTFAVASQATGMRYTVEIRSLVDNENACTCPDYRVNGLGTCKHVEAVLEHLRKQPRKFTAAAAAGSPRAEIHLQRADRVRVRITMPPGLRGKARELARGYFDEAGVLLGPPADAVPVLERAIAGLTPAQRRKVRLGRDVSDWAAAQLRSRKRDEARRAFLADVDSGKRSMHFTSQPLYPYQEEGMLHLAFGERAMLVDDMGLGKTVQAIAACALLRELRGIDRVLVVAPVSLKTEWEEQIRKFTDLPLQLVIGPKHVRTRAYRQPSFFNIVNYEQVLYDVEEINTHLAPDVVILDEAQRIKNWSTKTAQAAKRLKAPFAFVLTGTPLENRIDEIYSITEFLDGSVFGPLFRFNREFYELDERGRPAGYHNLEELRRRVRPLMLRRRKEDVEDQLPERVDNNYFVEMAPEQRAEYADYELRVARLAHLAKRRSLTREEFEKLMKWLNCMRMLCDTTFILDQQTRVCPKLSELERVFEDLGLNNGRKALVFSEWERMLTLVRDLAGEMKLGFAWHTGSVPQSRRRQEINRFKSDPDCKLFLSTDSGGVGLNLQAASVVINLDLPWNPAKLEQRIARAWRKHQTRAVHVVNLITEDSIEHRMLQTLDIKRQLAEGIVDGRGDLAELKMPSGREAFLKRLQLVMGAGGEDGGRRAAAGDGDTRTPAGVAVAAPEPCEPQERFRQEISAELSNRIQLVRTGPLPGGGTAALVVVDQDAGQLGPVIERIRERSGLSGKVEVLDRQTFEAMERLVALGLAAWPGGEPADLVRSPALKRPGPSPEERRRKKAQQLVNEASRKAKMADLLAAGGFPVEAMEPLCEGMETTLRGMAVMVLDDEETEPPEKVPISLIHGKLVTGGWLTAADASQVSTIREIVADGEISAELAVSLLEPGKSIIAAAESALIRRDLGRVDRTR